MAPRATEPLGESMLSIIQLFDVAACGARLEATAGVELAKSAADAAKKAIFVVGEPYRELI